MKRLPRVLLVAVGIFAFPCVFAGELKKAYFTATKPGGWSEYVLTSSDGSKSSFLYEREADEEGRPVIMMRVKILAGAGKDTKVKNFYTLPRGFDLDHQGLNYAKFTEKMSMEYSGAQMPVDEDTLRMIREGEKDFRGAVNFEASEKVDGRACDRYSYAIRVGGPAPTRETGALWLDASVPFGIVRHSAKVTREDGTPVTDFDMRLAESGTNQAIAVTAPPPAEQNTPETSSNAGLKEGFLAGYIGMEVEAVKGSNGRRLSITLKNKTEREFTVEVPAGDLDIDASSPVNVLKLSVPKAVRIVLPAGEEGGTFEAGQRGARGIKAGKCSLSVYEGTPLFSGSVEIDNLPKQ